MGGSLSFFDVRVAGPQIELLAYGNPCFYLVTSRGKASRQDVASAKLFCRKFTALVESAGIGSAPTPGALTVIDQAPSQCCALILDQLNTEIENEEKEALAQLGYHLIAAYLQYCDSSGGSG
jgi:hypothetical protein